MWEDGGGTYFDFFGNSSRLLPLTPSFPYLLLHHKIGLDFISGKVLILKQAHHISSAECLIFVVFYRYDASKKLLSDQGREFVNTINADLAKNQYRPHDYGSVPSPNKWT